VILRPAAKRQAQVSVDSRRRDGDEASSPDSLFTFK
jgi:hypothetical protein